MTAKNNVETIVNNFNTEQSNDVKNWFEHDFEPYLIDSKENNEFSTLMHPFVLFNYLYEKYYSEQHPNDKMFLKISDPESFKKNFVELIQSHGWKLIYRPSNEKLNIKNYHALPFDWAGYTKKHPLHPAFEKSKTEPFNRNRNGWFRIIKA